MSKAKFEAARELIQEKRYAEARAILQTINHPKAKEWLAKLDALEGAKVKAKRTVRTAAPAKQKVKRSRRTGCTVLFMFGLLAVVWAATHPSRPARPAATGSSVIAVQATASGTISNTATQAASATITDTATASATTTETPVPSLTDIPGFTPEIGALMTMQPVTWYTKNTVNVRTCADRSCDTLLTLPGGAEIVVTGAINGEEVEIGNFIWYRIDASGRDGYIYGNLVTSSRPTATRPPATPVQLIPQVTNPPAPAQSFTCPRNCTDAVAMGLSAEQAAQCPNLDRDHDGVACYGD